MKIQGHCPLPPLPTSMFEDLLHLLEVLALTLNLTLIGVKVGGERDRGLKLPILFSAPP